MNVTTEERIKWYRTPVDRDVLRDLTRPGSLRPLLQVGGHILFSVFTGWFAVYSFLNFPWPVTLLAVYIHGTFYNFLGMFTGIHELTHGTVFKNRKLGEAIYYILGILTWNNIYKFHDSHFAHHRFTCHREKDQEVVLPEKFRPIDWFFMFTVTPVSGAGGVPGIYSMIAETVKYAFGIMNTDWEHRLFPESTPKKRKKVFNYARLTLLVHAVLAAYFIWSGLWILLFVVTFGSFIAPWLAILCALPQHIGLKGDTPDWRVCCRTVLMSPFIRFFYWNMNYHIEHHMYASVPFYNLPKLHRVLSYDLPEPRRGLFATWRKEIIPILRRQRTDPAYCFVPELPS